jgi:hypothetical protein
VINGKNINERAKKKGKPQVVQDETDGNEEEKNAAVEQEPTTIAPKEAQAEPEDVVSEPLPEAVPDIPTTPSKPALPFGVIENEEGKQGFTVNGKVIVEPEYELVTPYGKERLIVRKDGKDGVLAINGETVSELVPCIFKGLSATKKHKYSVKMGGGYSEAHNEEFLKSVIQQTDQHLLVRTKDGHIAIVFHSKQIGVYKDVIYLGKDLFIVVNDDDKYGLIRGGTIRADIIRPFEYVKIELSEDKRNVLLYKTGRARFIPLHSLI